MPKQEAKFQVGQIIHHKLFDYIGAVFDVDPTFQGTDDWYEHVARSRPPKDKPWYHVLVDASTSTTYAAEENLTGDESGAAVSHPLIETFFVGFQDGRYTRNEQPWV